MAVEIPRINRFDSQGPQSVGRIEANAPNLLASSAPLREGFNNLASTTLDVVEARNKALRKQELAAKDLKATELAIRYEQSLKGDLDRLKQLKGDPTPVYKQFDEKMYELENTTYSQVGEDAETQAMLKEKMVKVNGRIYDSRTTNQTQQYYGWQNDVANGSVKLRKDNAMNSAAMFDVKKPLSYGGVRSALDEIEQTRISVAQVNGYDIKKVKDDNGGERWDYSNAPMIEAQIKADIGDAVIPMVKSLNSAGKVNEAKFVIEDNKKWLNADDLAKLTSDNDEASVKNRALENLAKQSSWSLDQINALPDVGEDVKLKMREINHTNALHAERERSQKVNKVMNTMYQEIQAARGTTSPYVSADDFKNRSKLWQNNKDMLSIENMKTIDKLVTDVEETDPRAFNEAMGLVQSGELTTIGGERLLNLRSKIEDKVWNKVFDTYFRNNLPDTESRKQANIAFATKEVTSYFTKQTDQYGNPAFPQNKKGKYSNATDEQLVASAQQQLADIIGSNPSMSTKEIQDKAKELYNDALKARDESTPGWIKGVRSFMDGFRSQNPLLGGKRPSLSTTTANANEAAVKITPDQVQNNPPAATQQNIPAATQNGGNMAKWSPVQWFQAYDADPANKNRSFANPQDKQKAVKEYARKQLGK